MGAVFGRRGMPLAVLAALFSCGNTPRLEPPADFTASVHPPARPTLPPASAHSCSVGVDTATSPASMPAMSGAEVNDGNIAWMSSPHMLMATQIALLVLYSLVPTPFAAAVQRAHSAIALAAFAVQQILGMDFWLLQDGIMQLLLSVAIALCLHWRHARHVDVDLDAEGATDAAAGAHSESVSEQLRELLGLSLTTLTDDNKALVKQNNASEAECREILEAKRNLQGQLTASLEEIRDLKAKLSAECKKHEVTRNGLRARESQVEEAKDKLALAEIAGKSLETQRLKKQAIQDEINALRTEHTRVYITNSSARQLRQAIEALVQASSPTDVPTQTDELISEVAELLKRFTAAKQDEKQATQKVMDLQGKQYDGTQTESHASPESSLSSGTPTTSGASRSASEKSKTIFEAPIDSESSRSKDMSPLAASSKELPSMPEEPSSLSSPSTSQKQGEDQISTTSAPPSPEPFANTAQPTTHSINPELPRLLDFFKANPAPDLRPLNPTKADGSSDNVEAVPPLANTMNATQPSPATEQKADSVFLPMHSALSTSHALPKAPAPVSGAATDLGSSLRIAALNNAQSTADSRLVLSTSSNASPSSPGAAASGSASTSMSAASMPSAEDDASQVQPAASTRAYASSKLTAGEAEAPDSSPSAAAPPSTQTISSPPNTTPASTSNLSSGIPGLFTRSEQPTHISGPIPPPLCFYSPHIKARKSGRPDLTFPCGNGKTCVGDPSQYDQSNGRLINSGRPGASLFGGCSQKTEERRKGNAWAEKLCYECFLEENPPSEVDEDEKDEPRVDENAREDRDFDEDISANEANTGEQSTREQNEKSEVPQVEEYQNMDVDFGEEVYGKQDEKPEVPQVEEYQNMDVDFGEEVNGKQDEKPEVPQVEEYQNMDVDFGEEVYGKQDEKPEVPQVEEYQNMDVDFDEEVYGKQDEKPEVPQVEEYQNMDVDFGEEVYGKQDEVREEQTDQEETKKQGEQETEKDWAEKELTRQVQEYLHTKSAEDARLANETTNGAAVGGTQETENNEADDMFGRQLQEDFDRQDAGLAPSANENTNGAAVGGTQETEKNEAEKELRRRLLEKLDTEYAEDARSENEKTNGAAVGGTQMVSVDGFTQNDVVEATNLTGVESGPSPPAMAMPGQPDPSVYQDPGMTFDQAMEQASYQSRRHGPYDNRGG